MLPGTTNNQHNMYRYCAAAAALCIAGVLMNACARSSGSNVQSSASPEVSTSALVTGTSPVASATSASAETSPAANAGTPVTYTDLENTPGQREINELASLGVFGVPSGAFNPGGAITRGDFVKWLVLANNALYADSPDKQIRPSQSTTSSYPDVATSHPDFTYIQGMYDAGFAIGFPDKTFKPNALLTHEQMIAIKESVDRGGVQQNFIDNWSSTMPNWKDKAQINKMFRGAIAEDYSLDRSAVLDWSHPNLVIDNVPRAFGAIAMFRPQDTVTRAQAALVLWKIGAHTDQIGNPTPSEVPRSADDALAPPASPAPTGTPTP
jgi:hypothetical protein